MKCIFLIIMTILLSSSAKCQIQCFIKYTYDSSGNRIKREYVCEHDDTPDEIITELIDDNGKRNYLSSITQTLPNKDFSSKDTLLTDTYFLVYPNPNKGVFWVEFLKSISISERKYRIYILNSEGKLMMNVELSGSKNYIDLTEVSSGNYFIVINDGIKNSSHKIVLEK